MLGVVMSLTINAPDPLVLFVSSGQTESLGSFTFSYSPFGARITEVVLEKGTYTDPATNTTYTVDISTQFGFEGSSGIELYTIEIPDEIYAAVTGTFVAQFTIRLCSFDPQTFVLTGIEFETINVYVEGDRAPTPPPPRFTAEEKAKFLSDAAALTVMSAVCSDTAALLDPLHPLVKFAGNLAGQFASVANPLIGGVNTGVQFVLAQVASALDNAPAGLNPISLTLTIASIIDSGAAFFLKQLAEDPPSHEFTTVYQAPDWSFGAIAGVSAAGNALLQDAWKLLQAAANALAASERYQGAQLAGDSASEALQEAAFNGALDAYQTQRQALSHDLRAFLVELQETVSDFDLTGASFEGARDYLASLDSPWTQDSHLADLVDSIEGFAGFNAIYSVQQAVDAILDAETPVFPGSAFSAMSDAADTLASAGESTVQGFYVALFNRPADPFGLAFWEGLTSNGADLTVLINGDPSRGIGSLTSVPEYTARFAGLSNTEVVNSIFQSLFGRDGDAGGLAFYVDALASGAQNIETIAINIYDGALGTDLETLLNKEMAANKFTSEIDTQAEIDAYNASTIALARAHLVGVTDDLTTVPTFVEAAAAVQAMVGASVSVIGTSVAFQDL